VRQIVHRTNDPDVLGACLRIFRDPEDLDTVRAFLGDPRWQVRVQAASALGRVGTADDEPRLARMLGDPEWWVRYRAAHAVAALLADAPERLDRLQRQHPNPFARDILRQVQAERQLQ
jgi:HEAT repeat protein